MALEALHVFLHLCLRLQLNRVVQTYKKAIVYPGPRLNLVLGPNGMCPLLARAVLHLDPD